MAAVTTGPGDRVMAAAGRAAPSMPPLAALAVAAAAAILPAGSAAALAAGGGGLPAGLPASPVLVGSAAAAPSSQPQIAAHEQAMLKALAMPARTPGEIAAREAAIAAARAREPDEARGRPPGCGVVERIDQLLGLPPADPTLGIGRR